MVIGRAKRREIYYKTDGRCAYCGKPLDPFIDWQIDHMKPSSCNGSDDISNLVAACRSCNAKKRDKDVEEFRKWFSESILKRTKWIKGQLEQNGLMLGAEMHENLMNHLIAFEDAIKSASVRFYLDECRVNTEGTLAPVYEKSPLQDMWEAARKDMEAKHNGR